MLKMFKIKISCNVIFLLINLFVNENESVNSPPVSRLRFKRLLNADFGNYYGSENPDPENYFITGFFDLENYFGSNSGNDYFGSGYYFGSSVMDIGWQGDCDEYACDV